MRPKSLVIGCAVLSCAFASVPVYAQRGHRGGGGPFYSPYYSGFSQWYPYPYPYPPFVFGPGPLPDHIVALRLQVTPREALVYVDGFAAGSVDDYDGVFQRLRLIPGPHEIVIYHPGHRTLRQSVYYNPGSSHTIRYTLDALAPGEPLEPQPTPRAVPPPPPPGMAAPAGPPSVHSSRVGTLALRIQPGDATILIDGEPWSGPTSQDRVVIPLSEGSHRIRVEKSGFQTFAVDIDVRAGETTSFNVSLVR